MDKNDTLIKDCSISKYDAFVFWFTLIDVLFLPYFWLISIPFSMPIVFYWFVKNIRRFTKLIDFKVFIFIFITMVLSSIIGATILPKIIYNNFVFVIQNSYLFMVYFLFWNYLRFKRFDSKKILLIFTLFIAVSALVYYIDKNIYLEIIRLWNFRSGTALANLYSYLEGYRFSFVWTDPNNISYMISSITLYLWTNENLNPIEKFFTLITLIFVLVTTMSRGGFIAFFVASFAYLSIKFVIFLYRLFTLKLVIKRRINIVKFIGRFLVILFSLSILLNMHSILESSVILESIERIEANSLDSRIEIWSDIQNNFGIYDYLQYFFIGTGGAAILNGSPTSPHNGHLYWIISYGFMSYVAFMYFVFRKRKSIQIINYIWIIPAFLGFSVNIMIGELKLVALLFLLINLTINKASTTLFRR